MTVAFTRSSVKMEPVKGGLFELFGGAVTGSFIELVSDLVNYFKFI